MEQALTAYLIVPSDIDLCRTWGAVRASRASAGHPISPQDAWIAATALRHNLALITHNASDYQGIAHLAVQSVP